MMTFVNTGYEYGASGCSALRDPDTSSSAEEVIWPGIEPNRSSTEKVIQLGMEVNLSSAKKVIQLGMEANPQRPRHPSTAEKVI